MKYKLKEIGNIITGKTPNTSETENFSCNKSKYLFITPRDMKINSKYIKKTERYLTDFVTKKMKHIILEGKSICISCIGSDMGKVYIIDGLSITNQQINSITNINEICNPEYLYYYFKDKKEFFKSIAGGSTMPILKKSDFEDIIVDLPERYIQDKIVKILNSLDEKIELNNKINNNLYELSRTIFNELYKKSENWHGCKIQDIGLYVTDYVANGSFKSLADNVKIYNTKNYALFVRNTDLKVNFTQERKYVDEHSYKFLNKSKLIGRELIISNVGDVGSVYLCPSYKIPMTLGNNVIMVNSKGLRVNYNYYLYYFFLSIAGQYLIDGITGGSAQPKFNKTDFRNSIIKIPSDDEIVEFNKKIIPLYDIIEKNIMENETLSKLRDTLLPKLMNGEIDLDKIEI